MSVGNEAAELPVWALRLEASWMAQVAPLCNFNQSIILYADYTKLL